MLSNLNINLITQQFKDFIKSFSNENIAEKQSSLVYLIAILYIKIKTNLLVYIIYVFNRNSC